jgi:hypothetical protein
MILRNGKFSGKILRKIFRTGKFSTSHHYPQVIHEYGGPRWNDTDRVKLKNPEKNLSQCHLVYHKSHID